MFSLYSTNNQTTSIMLLLTFLSFVPLYSAFDLSSCIKFETYLTTQYKMAPLDFSHTPWFSHSFRFSPKIVTRISLRSRRLLGCCDAGYQYKSFPIYGCRPICVTGCPLNAFCSEPNQCTCNVGYYKTLDGLGCLSYDTSTTIKTTTDLTTETTSPKIPCNGSCPSNEVCSDDICVCQSGYQRLNNGGCFPKCDNGCQNADCTSPNICTCWPHYEQTNDTSCHVKCTELSCTFGTCNANGICICAEGFFNNGTNCLWAGDDIFSEPDECECWSKFMWQQNVTESRCTKSCEDLDNNNSKELTSDCIPVSDCEYYEGYTICQTQMYKCIEMPTPTTTVISFMADKVIKNSNNTSTEMTSIIVGFLALIILVVGLSLLVWQIRRRNLLNRLFSYNTMGTNITHPEE